MARTVQQLLDHLLRLVPAQFAGLEQPLSAVAASAREAEVTGESTALLVLIGSASGRWLDLIGYGIGIRRASGEGDTSYRKRLRRIREALTKPAIKGAVDNLLTTGTSSVIEWFEGPYLDVAADVPGAAGVWLDSTILNGGPNFFLVKIPSQGVGFEWGEFLDSELYLDSGFLGLPEDPIYLAIINQVEKIRGAGTSWRLIKES